MKVYTRRGDDGTTALADGRRVSKAAARVWAYGEVDELSATLGLLRAEGLPPEVDARVAQAQACLFSIGAFLADPRGRVALEEDIARPTWVEAWIDAMEEELPPLRNFIVPGGTRAAAAAHLARTTCRRAERRVVQALSGAGGSGLERVVPFLNRLSDALFVLARLLNRRAGIAETVWRGRG